MQYERLSFSKNWNNKLLCDVFTTIRPVANKYNIDEEFDIRIEEQHFCYAKVLKKSQLRISDIINSGLHLTDTGMNEKDFFGLMHKMYSKKSWWKDKDTEMEIVFFKKVTQLTIFDDGKYPSA